MRGRAVLFFISVLLVLGGCSNEPTKSWTTSSAVSFYDGDILVDSYVSRFSEDHAAPILEKDGYSLEGWIDRNASKILTPGKTFRPNRSTHTFEAVWCSNEMKDKLSLKGYGHAVACNDRGVREVEVPDIFDGQLVTSIWDRAFESCTLLESVKLPDSVTSIASNAFYKCTALEKINFPKSLSDIRAIAFYECSSLSEIALPEGVKTIGYGAFSHCTALAAVSLPDSVTLLDNDAFYYCTSLSSVEIGSRLKAIGSSAFESTGLSRISIPSNVVEIGKSAFSQCRSLSEVELHDGLTTIGESAFSYTGLEEILLPSSLTYIGKNAFTNTKLKTVTIPAKVTAIEPSAFSGCKQLVEILVEKGNQYYISIDGVLYDKAGENVIIWPEGKAQ